ncbi:MAG TPA: alpha/beta fold hydrolase [Thermoanaerobaculia bacterium]|nr:alpha/beta fold hydrolase [Thermoanaerobaculia bacterium]
MIRNRRALILAALAAGSAAAVLWRRRPRPWAGRPREPEGALGDCWTRVDGLKIYTRVSCDPVPGRMPVVLVHGFGVSSRYMVPIGRRLAVEMPVYAPDLPGHGRSDDPERALDVPELAGFLRRWMDAAGLARAAFLANSMGCQIVAELAVRWPERADRLILIGPTAEAGVRAFWPHLLRLLKIGWVERPSLLFLVTWDYARAGPLELYREMRHMFADRIEDKLPRIEVPVLVLRGEKDAVVPQRWAEQVARLAGAAGVSVIPGAAHALNYSAADELMRTIRPFLRGRA